MVSGYYFPNAWVDGHSIVLPKEGVQAIADGLMSNTQSQLAELYLGWNGIGDEGPLKSVNCVKE